MTDDELYRQYLSGNQEAGDALILRWSDALTVYLDAFLHNAQDAEDLMMDCFAVILLDKPKIADGHFRAYLFKTARNKANRLWRLRFRRQEFSLDEAAVEAVPAKLPSAEDALIETERAVILSRCLNRIAPQYREALWLFYYMDAGYAQAAEIMGCSEKRIDNLLRNGKARLRLELEKEGITHADT